MSRPHLALDFSFLHSSFRSVVVLKVYVTRIAVRKGKGKPPILVDLYRPSTGPVSLKLMQTEVREGHIFQSIRRVDHVKPITQTGRELWGNSALAICFEELAQAFMLK